MSGDAVTITLPAAGYEHVARLVTGGLASRLDFGFEAVDDLQLAVELVLRSLPDRRGSVTLSLVEDGSSLYIEVAPAGGLTLDGSLASLDGAGVALGASLERLVDTVSLTAGDLPAVVLGTRAAGEGMKSTLPLSEVDRRALLRAYREDGDLAARDRLVEAFMPLVSSLARRYAGRGEQFDDLQQVAALGLVKAIERFDLDREVDLVTYIFPTVVGELKRHFRDRVWSVTVPRRLKELHQLLSRLIEDLTSRNGRSPTIPELALAAGVTEEEVVEGLEAGRAYSARSLTATHDVEDGAEVALIDLLEDEETGYEEAENRDLLASGIHALDERERMIVRLRFADGLTQSEIATQVGVSQMHVSRLLRRALEKLGEEIEAP